MDVRDLAAQHDALTERFKLYEQRVGQLPPVEVLNELRYALRAAIEFITLRDAPNPSAERERELIARMDHALKCAYHDLIDGFVIELTESLANLLQTYPTSTYAVVGGKVADIRRDIDEIQKVISQSRGNPESRAEVYEKKLYDGWFEKLMEHRSYLSAAIPEIARLQEKRDRDERGLRRRQWMMLVGGVIAGLVLKIPWNLL